MIEAAYLSIRAYKSHRGNQLIITFLCMPAMVDILFRFAFLTHQMIELTIFIRHNS